MQILAAASDSARKEDPGVKAWLDEISQALKREDDFRKDGMKVAQIYEGVKKKEIPFNILYSNTETLAPALYNSTPRPLVKRRFSDPDPLAALASKAVQRTLEYLIDDGMANYATFDELMKSASLESLVPGRGISRFRYEATLEKHGEGETAYESVSDEMICGEEVPWDRFLHGYAKKWKDVPWVSFEHFMTREELVKNFGAEIGNQIELGSPNESTDRNHSEGERKSGMGNVRTAQVYEIWDKLTRKVHFVTPSWSEGYLRQVDDPLGLTGFFPCPKPLGMIAKISTLIPVCLYTMYEEQAKELNAVTTRITNLIKALKIRGIYDGQVDGISTILESEENTLIPANNVAALSNNGTLDKAIWLFPIKDIIPVLQQLYLQRQQVKQVIYEITGIADIMRGSSVASETLGAQEIKNQWGTLRLKRAQKEMARYARDSLRIMAEIAVTKLSPETLQGMTGLPIPTAQQKQQSQFLVQQAAAVGQQPPPQALKIAQSPSWDDVLGLLRDDLQRSYRIDIETNSTIDAEATEDKQDIGELLNALAQFMNAIGPLIESKTMPFEAAKSMMMAIIRRFKFGTEVEEQIGSMQEPPPPQDPNAAKAAAEGQALQMQAQIDKDKATQDAQMRAMELQYKQQEFNLKMAALQRQDEYDRLAHQRKMQEIEVTTAATIAKARASTQQKPKSETK